MPSGKNSQVYLNNIKETSNPRSGLNESHIISIPLKTAFRRAANQNRVCSSPDSIVSDNSQGLIHYSGKFSRQSMNSPNSRHSKNSNSIYIEKSLKLSMAATKAQNQQRLVKAKNLRPKYDFNGRKITDKNGKAQVYESKDSRTIMVNKRGKATVFEKIMNKFHHNVSRGNVGEGLIGGQRLHTQKSKVTRRKSQQSLGRKEKPKTWK